ncbi:MAG: STAS/SEC14 domain-containing protein [Cyanobacteria bacterium]|nr:STAS/SEC14 domain-containing protein [Cyanobacteriota bacterium]
MIEVISESEGGAIALKASGTLSHQDYQEVLVPRVERLIERYGKARVLLDLSEDFHGWDEDAMWDDTKFGIEHRNDFAKLAIIGDLDFYKWDVRLVDVIESCPVVLFRAGEFHKAWRHVRSH